MPAHTVTKRPRLAAPGDADENQRRTRFKKGAALTPGSYPPLHETNPSEPVASTSATTLDALSTRAPTPTTFPPSASCPDEDTDDPNDGQEKGRRIFRRQDLVPLVRTSFDPRIVPTADNVDDRSELRRWIPRKYLKDGALAPEGLFIANSLTCVRLNGRVAKRNRREGVVVVPRGHDDLKELGDKDMWCLICPETSENMEGVRQEFNPRIGKADRHVWKPVHRQSVAAALDIPVEKLPPEQRYQCPFYENPRCGHKWSGRTDPVVRHTNRVCKANPHSLENVEKYGLLPFPDDEKVFVDDSMWRPTKSREGEARDVIRDSEDEEDDIEVESEDEVLPSRRSSTRSRSADAQGSEQDTTASPAPSHSQPPPASRVAKPEAEGHPPPSRPTRRPSAASTMPQAGPSTAAGGHPPSPFTAPQPAPAPASAPTSGATVDPQDELAFMSQFFDFDAYEADHRAWCAQREAERRSPGESSPLKRKGE